MTDLHNIFADDLEKAVTNTVKSTSRKISDLKSCIETALSEGYKHKDIFDYLNRSGLEVAWNTYDTALARARGKSKEQGRQRPKQSMPAIGQSQQPHSRPAMNRTSSGPVLPPEPRDTKVTMTYDPLKDF